MRIISTKVNSILWSIVRRRAEVRQICSLMDHMHEERRTASTMRVHIARLVAAVNVRVGSTQVVGIARTDCIPGYWICMPSVQELETDQQCCLHA